MSLFRKVLVANRGEIAVRIFRTLKRLGIPSVAVYSDADLESLHVEYADEAVRLGPPPAGESYLNVPALLQACAQTGADAVHPGYGFLSENAEFARQLAEKGLCFVGPTPENLTTFGLKHLARAAARQAAVPLLPGTGLLESEELALEAASGLGWPVILKSTGGGGGIGMKVCRNPQELREAFLATKALAERNFKDSGVYLERFVERARHVEVQVFGDGKGGVAILGDRDCSAQRRNQKVIEEAPAPGLSDTVRANLHEAAHRLTSAQNYANAGTVEFVLDADSQEFFFLEVNTRLQVEHTVTEEIFGIDLVEWMLRQSAGVWAVDEAAGLRASGSAIQVRLYAEDPWKGFLPSEGLVTQALWPENTRVETWVRPGVSVSSFYDPLLAKLIVHEKNRSTAVASLERALTQLRFSGLQTNRAYLKAILESPVFQKALTTTSFLASFSFVEPSFEVLQPGAQTTIQDWPGRRGYWQVGIPPSGPMDELSFRLANRLLGNPEGTPGIEITLKGPLLKFRASVTAVLTGAECGAVLDGIEVPFWTPFVIQAGQVLALGTINGPGQRAYLALGGGVEVPEYLGSASTFTLGGFGGYGGRALCVGDVVPFAVAPESRTALAPMAKPIFLPGWQPTWIRVTYGPQGAPEYFREDDLFRFLNTDWEVHFHSSRTGIRLIGPTPDWPRTDGGDAGLHPSNLHDNPYAVGALDFTGDMPVLLGPDGPSLGGFVCPFTVIHADLWKLGQLRPGDKVRFQAVGLETARAAAQELEELIRTGQPPRASEPEMHVLETPLLDDWQDSGGRRVALLRSGDRNLLLEVGEPVLDLELRLIVQWWYNELEKADLPGVIDLTPGIRSLQIHLDDQKTTWEFLLSWLRGKSSEMGNLDDVEVPSRTVWLPLSWDDPSTRLAIEKYTSSVRPDAPWCPWNIEFIRRINGLDSWESVWKIAFEASYLVLGLGDVYLGAPVATPLDPRHRLVTTKYNPARTWTPENAVGIGGAYLCVYGMEGPGGYQFIGRTVQMWNRFFTTSEFSRPWLLRFFDKIRFYPVTAEELLALRRDFPLGRAGISIEEGVFRWKEYRSFLAGIQDSTKEFRDRQQAAFAAERQRWKDSGQDAYRTENAPTAEQEQPLPEGELAVEAPLAGSLWQWTVKPGDEVLQGQSIALIDSMKMEIHVEAPCSGQILALHKKVGESVKTGQILASMKERK
jgi:urea carboxylase